jgi:hypothetical protein
MKKRLKDYLHFYQGIDCFVDGKTTGKLIGYSARGFSDGDLDVFYTVQIGEEEDDWTVYNDDENMQRIQPLLYPLNSMTEEQAITQKVFSLIFTIQRF